MSLLRTAHTTTAAYRARYAAEMTDPGGTDWRVEFIDNDLSLLEQVNFGQVDDTVPHEIKMTESGFTLDYDGATDHVASPIVPSKCEVTFIIENDDHERMITRLKAATDGRFGLAIYKSDGTTWQPFWAGPLVHEAIEWELHDQAFLITLTASCGLNRLADIPFNDDQGDPYQGLMPLAELISICLDKIPTAPFWLSADDYLSEVVDIYNEDQSGSFLAQGEAFEESVIQRTLVHAEAFYTTKDSTTDNYGRRIYRGDNFSSCLDVIENIARAFGARVFQSEFKWWFFPPNAYNYDTELGVRTWTRQTAETEGGFALQLGSGTYNVTGTHTEVDFVRDIDGNHSLVRGYQHSFLLPMQSAVVVHKNAGQQSVFGTPDAGYIDYPTWNRNYANPEIQVLPGQTLNLRGLYNCIDGLRQEFGILGGAFDDYGFTRIGARIILRLKIKVGGLYYVSEHYVNDQTTVIEMPAGTGDLNSKRIFLNTPEWTSTEGFFDIIVPWTNSNPAADTLPYNRVAGLHVKAEGDNAWKYEINGTQQDSVSHPFNFITAPMPDGASSYDGIEVYVDRVVRDAAGTLFTSFDDLENVFQSVAVVDYNETGASGTFEAPEDRLDDFSCFIGDGGEDSDIIYSAVGDDGIESIDLGETLIGDSNLDGEAQTFGATNLIPAGSTTNEAQLSNYNWLSITDTAGVHEESALLGVLSREMLFLRAKALPVQRGQIQQHYNSGSPLAPLLMTSIISHNCSTPDTTEDQLVPFRMRFQSGTGLYDVDAFVFHRIQVIFAPDEEIVLDTTGGGGGSGGGSGDGSVGGNGNDSHVGRLMENIEIEQVQRELVIPADMATNPRIRVRSYNTTDNEVSENGVQFAVPQDMTDEFTYILPEAKPTSASQRLAVQSISGNVVYLRWETPGGGGGSGFKLAFTFAYSDTTTADKFFVQNAVTELSGTNAARDYRSAVTIPIAGSLDQATSLMSSAQVGDTHRLIVWINNTATYYSDGTGVATGGSRALVQWDAWKNVSDDSDVADPTFSADDYLAFQLIPQDTPRPANPGSISLSVLTSHT